MGTWILIVTLYLGDGVAMHHAEFDTEQACGAAGTAWAEQNKPSAKHWGTGKYARFICVPKGGDA